MSAVGSIRSRQYQHNKHIEEQRLRFRAVVLQEIERDPSVLIQGDDFAVNQGAGREPFTGTGDLRELLCEEVSLARTTAWPRLSPCRQDNGSCRT
jgi:hypothetical protein